MKYVTVLVADSHREILGHYEGTKEDRESWRSRGLTGGNSEYDPTRSQESSSNMCAYSRTRPAQGISWLPYSGMYQ